MSTIQMTEVGIEETIHLFETMKKYGIKCSVEMHRKRTLEPILAIFRENVSAEYLENEIMGDSLIVYLGEAEFSFDLKDYLFFKHVGDTQISITISDNVCAFLFDSGEVPPEVIEEAKEGFYHD